MAGRISARKTSGSLARPCQDRSSARLAACVVPRAIAAAPPWAGSAPAALRPLSAKGPEGRWAKRVAARQASHERRSASAIGEPRQV